MAKRRDFLPWVARVTPAVVLAAAFLAIANSGDPYRRGVGEVVLLAGCYLSLAATLHFGAFAAMAGARWIGHCVAIGVGGVGVWAFREGFSIPASVGGFGMAVLGAGLVYGGFLRWQLARGLAPLPWSVVGVSALSFLALVFVTFHASGSARGYLLRQNSLIGTPAYYLLAEPMQDVYDGLWVRSRAAEPQPMPEALRADVARNIVFILVDTWRADALSAYREDVGLMPEVDAIAEGCIVFDDVQANSSWTRASVGSYFSGLRPEEHGATDRGYRLLEENATMAEIFDARGYETAAFVANYANAGRDAGFDQGFALFEELDSPVHPYARADEVNEAVLAYLDSREGEGPPLFLYVHYLDPHTPYLSGIDGDERRGNGRFSVPQRHYDAELRFTDQHLSALIASLRARLDGDTVYFITSDHGEELGEHGLVGHGHTLHREVVHLPALLCAAEEPARRIAGRLEARDFHDLLPRLGAGGGTPLEVWASERNGARGGHRYSSSYVRTKAAAIHRPGQSQSVLRALESADWRLMWSGFGETFELYERASDPWELFNQVAVRPEVASSLSEELEAEIEWWSLLQSDAETDETFDQLRELGYVE
jgi:arylsulfatase A-like enzyme